MIEKLISKAKHLVNQHGPEVGAIAKIAAHALIPGAPLIVSSVEALCDYNAEKGHEIDQAALMAKLESLGGDTAHLDKVLGYLSEQLEGVIGMMSQAASFGLSEAQLGEMIQSAIDRQFTELKDELRGLSARFESVERQNQRIIEGLSIEGDKSDEMLSMLRELRQELAELKGTPEDQRAREEAIERLYQAQTLQDLEGLYQSLNEEGWSKELKRLLRVVLLVLRGDSFKAIEASHELKHLKTPRAQTIAKSVDRVTKMSFTKTSTPQNKPQKSLKLGDQIGSRGWKLCAQIGDGGMGSVWRVENRFHEVAALKVIHADLQTNPELVKRFQSEIKTLGAIKHPAVIEIIDWGEAKGIWYLVMPFISGKSLANRLRYGSLDSESTKELARSLASALVACHSRGVIHRDIKPDNIMLREDGSPVLIDFGIAHQEGLSTGKTTMATRGYAPPEQQAGRSVDATVDLYALGMTLAECLGSRAEVEP